MSDLVASQIISNANSWINSQPTNSPYFSNFVIDTATAAFINNVSNVADSLSNLIFTLHAAALYRDQRKPDNSLLTTYQNFVVTWETGNDIHFYTVTLRFKQEHVRGQIQSLSG